MTLTVRTAGIALTAALFATIGSSATAQDAKAPKTDTTTEQSQAVDIGTVMRTLETSPDFPTFRSDLLKAAEDSEPTAFPGDLFAPDDAGTDRPTAFPGDLFGHDEEGPDGPLAFPGDLFSVSETLRIQTEYLLERAKAGKSQRAVHDMTSQYREDVAMLGERIAQAAAVTKDKNPKQAKVYTDAARTLRSSLFTSVERNDLEATVTWLESVQQVHDTLSALDKKTAR
ncbi:hypothetical protein ACFFUB_05850 [Algimonas porphyrae]|uniref:Uncharacterized protein n=1 Tax=Algimonas porphyrae TaxID=1128113 RepID=A0ABQ5V4V4_9PROT|nr:hypothetical protein [Algimonas porphyrae]GLQ22107.1 hypothetical protein GCM10007854_30620 [Algimonas porphyrae]